MLEPAYVRLFRGTRALAQPLVSDEVASFLSTLYGSSERAALAFLNQDYRRNRARLRNLADAFAGQRCVVIGNGPSLNKIDLSLIGTTPIFALNRGYLLSDRLGRDPDFLVCVNPYVTSQFPTELATGSSLKFFSWRTRSHFAGLPNGSDAQHDSLWVPINPSGKFVRDIAKHGVSQGSTVTFVALQIAYFLGFTEVILVGVDHSFVTRGRPGKVVTTSEDPNHFDPSYFGHGVKWQLPDLDGSEVAYAKARAAFERSGRSIVNATRGGNLEVFERLRFEDQFA